MPTVAPVWLLTGPEIGERAAALAEIRKTAARSGELDAHLLYSGDVRMGEVVSLLQNGSLFAAARFVVLKGAEVIKKKEDVEMLTQWISSSVGTEEATLVLVSDEIGIDRKIEAAVPKEHKRVFWELFESRKEQWISAFFRKEGYEVDEAAVASILDLVENNTDALKTACSRLTLFFPKGHRVTEDDTISFLSHDREESPFTLFDAMTEGDLAGALEIVSKLSLSRESSPVQTIAGLSFCFRRLADWHRLADSGMTDDFSLKKAGFTSKKAVTQYRAAARRWDGAAVTRALALLANADVELRSSPQSTHGIIVDLAVRAALVPSTANPFRVPDDARLS